MPYVYSTATCSTDFVIYDKSNPDAPHNIAKHKITIKGGANVANKDIVTKHGIVTKVSDEDYEHLKTCPHFQKAVKAGFYVIEEIKANPEKVAKDMAPKDKSAPKTPSDPDLKGKFKK